MSTEKSDQEPSMEEILSSIRRIIADDDDEAASTKPAAGEPTKPKQAAARLPAPAAPAADEDDVLDLTQVVGRGEAADRKAAGDAPFDSELDELELEPDEEEPVPPPARGKAKPVMAAAEASMSEDDTLVSPTTASRSSGALAKLTKAAARSEPRPLASGDKTVEAFLLEMLRPMLKEWLDANLEGVVERVVEQEVKKLARRAELM
jgi:cell pole-organizing protein PopZ